MTRLKLLSMAMATAMLICLPPAQRLVGGGGVASSSVAVGDRR